MLAHVSTAIEVTGLASITAGAFVLFGLGVALIVAGAACVTVGVALGRDA